MAVGMCFTMIYKSTQSHNNAIPRAGRLLGFANVGNVRRRHVAADSGGRRVALRVSGCGEHDLYLQIVWRALGRSE